MTFSPIGVCRSDELGRKIALDHVSRAFKFEVSGLPIWNTEYQGYICLSDFRAEEA